ncbi:class I SAM-dependent rRNA methyltransferase [Pontibacter akesuensis]|uniref:SAM-dependent methyltransferase n=1 Tax=Pontibacter akesuensis TaxID=388950 RepID=A0A1I7G3U8_9BACT|nr:class I SAM-dependent rRNA methyltransferase [Pontibacter akesuensis]GHA59003.1 SAM-dependent methyltransferase [Pontibacter akesuensis]SFU43073.1 SAM-dependent methyltransferase [Pontibacter akesuensis]
MSFIKLYLAPGKEHSLQRQHPWVFSGAIRKADGEPAEGDVVEVYSSKREFLAMGHYALGSIAVRIFSFEQVEPDYAFWKQKVQKAYDYRQRLGLTDNPETDVYRLVYAEGDGVPGLIVDFYKDTAVVQTHSLGMYGIREHISKALQEIYGGRLRAVYDKSAESLPPKSPVQAENGYLFGKSEGGVVVTENGNKFFVDWESGQKTGFFIDQRENRDLLSRYVKDKSVLNTFCYTGGFSVYSLNAGAKEVHSVDVSKKAIELTDKNAELSQAPEKHAAYAMDTFEFMKGKEDKYDVIILDPPAFAKSKNVRHNALMGYKRLNAEALKKIKPGGILFTFSCSQVVDKYLFNNTVMAAAIDAGRKIKIMHHLSQPADHPISIFHPEGEYLKGLVLFVE